jgi:hypothetical protein
MMCFITCALLQIMWVMNEGELYWGDVGRTRNTRTNFDLERDRPGNLLIDRESILECIVLCKGMLHD